MKNRKLRGASVLISGLILATVATAQIKPENVDGKTSPQTSEFKFSSSSATDEKITQSRRAQAYAKLLEGQRHFWNSDPRRSRSSGTANANLRLAKQAFQKAVELDPTLSEGYTGLAEIALRLPPNDIEEALMLAGISVKINPNNFGARRLLARVQTIKSHLKTGTYNPAAAAQAVAEWREIIRLDPRSAEGWAFLSQFYARQGKTDEQIAALQKWQSAAAPLDTGFYRLLMGGQENLTADNAALKLGAALIKANRQAEAIEILSRIISDDADNLEAINLLKQIVDGNSAAASASVVESLQQAVYASPENVTLAEMLARMQLKAGKTGESFQTLKTSISRATDRNSVFQLQILLGDLYAETNQVNPAVSAYEDALKTQNIGVVALVNDADRETAVLVLGKMIQIYKSAGRINEAKATIERARILLGANDPFADRQLIDLLRETKNNQEALQSVRAQRAKSKDDYGLLRLEAQILTELGRVDEGASLAKNLIGAGKNQKVPTMMYDDFGNYIFISGLYSQAGRGKEAAAAAKSALANADSPEKNQIANITLASAYHSAGDYASAENTLRSILKEHPRNPIALNNLGYFLVEQNKNLEEAVAFIRQAVEIDPTNPSYLDSLGWAYFKLGKLGEAELYLKEAINNNPSAVSYEHLGDVYQKQGREELARELWQKALNQTTMTEIEIRLKSKLAK